MDRLRSFVRGNGGFIAGLLLALSGVLVLLLSIPAAVLLPVLGGLGALGGDDDPAITGYISSVAGILRIGGFAALGLGALLLWLSRIRARPEDGPPARPPDGD